MKEDVCGVCKQDEPPSNKKTGAKKKKNSEEIGWIGCDSCNKWFHTVCVRIGPALLAIAKDHLYLCERCSIVGCLLPKSQQINRNEKSGELQKRIDALGLELSKLRSEMELLQVNVKKQLDRLRNKLQTMDQIEDRRNANNMLVENIESKLELIQAGARLAGTCSQGVNCCRIAINKVPYHPNENIRSIVEDFLCFLGIKEKMSHVTACFRLPVKPSKWTDRNITPTVLVAFDSRETRTLVLKRYFEKHKDAKLCNLKSAAPLEYRFTVNEMLSVQAFRIRNLALRLKQKKIIQSIFVRNDKVSVRLPGQKRYIPVEDCSELIKLTEVNECTDESSMFFDAVSADVSIQQ